MKLKLPFSRQHYTGSAIGGFLDTYQRSVGILSIIQYIAMIIVLYTTSARDFLVIHFPWINFTVYMVIAFMLGAVVMLGAYKIAGPSMYGWWNQQIWKHDNPMRIKLEHMERNQKKIMEKLGIKDEDK